MSGRPQCRVCIDGAEIAYTAGVPCGCGATTCAVERDDEGDEGALGYQIEAPE